MKNKIKLLGFLTLLSLTLSIVGMAQTKIGYYYSYDYQTATFSDMTGQDLTCYGITAAVQNSVKRDSLALQMARYRALYPSAKITCVISTDTSIYTHVHNIKNFETLKSTTFDAYNLEREYWNGAGTFTQWCQWLRIIKREFGSVEAYLGKLVPLPTNKLVTGQIQADSIVKICRKIYLHNYYTIDKWSGKYCLDNDNSRMKYLAYAAYKNPDYNNSTFEVIPLIANNEQGNGTGFQTSYLDGEAVVYCYQSYRKALINSSIQYKTKLLVQSIQVYKKL